MEAVKAFDLAGRMIRMAGDPADPYFAQIEAFAAAEAPLAAWAKANLPADAVVLDVGGNIGLTALLLAGLCPDGEVHAFEALPRNAGYLRQNVRLNEQRNCTVVEAAVGDTIGRAAVSGSGSAAQVAPDASGDVPLTTLDSYAGQRGMTRLDFIKIDVEGYEPAVLEGAAGLIERFRPPILMEFNSWCLAYAHGFNPFAFAHEVWGAFEAYRLAPDGVAAPAGDVATFLHDNMVRHGAVDDVLLRLRLEGKVPKRGASLWGLDPAKLERLRQAEDEVTAMRQSTSWRVTAPLRASKRLLRSVRTRSRP